MDFPPIFSAKVINVDIIFLFSDVLNSTEHKNVVLEDEHRMPSSLRGRVLSFDPLPLLVTEREFPEVIERIDTIGPSKDVQILIITNHRTIRPALWLLIGPSKGIYLFPCHFLQIQRINIVHKFCFRRNVPTIDVHFLVKDGTAVRVDSWKLDVGLETGPFVFGNAVDVGGVAAL